MGLIETNETNHYTFEAFAAHEFYAIVNRALVHQAMGHLAPQQQDTPITIVDMACGTGAITRLIAEELSRLGAINQAHIIGVDPSAEALRRAQKGMDELGIPVKTTFVQGEAEDLPRLVQNANAAFFCNAIHLVPDKRDAFRNMASILAPGGFFACNSAFYEGTYVSGTERFYRLWTRRAVGWLRQHHPEVRPSRDAKAMAMQWLTPEQYVSGLKESGFKNVDTVTIDTNITLDGWRDLGQYWLFIEGALPGVPLAYAAEALGTAVYQVGEELSMTTVPRTWLQLVATRA